MIDETTPGPESTLVFSSVSTSARRSVVGNPVRKWHSGGFVERHETPHDLTDPVQIRFPGVIAGDSRSEVDSCGRCVLDVIPFGVELLLGKEEYSVSYTGTNLDAITKP